ncbi:NCS2 family permease [Listeria monocytogenes]|uniref:NCS2 family permease n=1 Tax=Listeria monocytogenes TaxID=1639 RepID=UPI000BDEB62E|nr:NCS2 family permease [Listeria monocytogenes]PCX59056.1 permease [Listeria monocytogenes]PCX66014.1 permease [Listeria monocytogenes]PCY33377.1 permease [Listeria monocytogenes]PCY39116.1 permease [Listeria monocytogenes]PDQ56686.1 permease [Listeria monocytogenes]
MQKFFNKVFRLNEHKTNIRTEFLAGMIGFFTVAYIIVVNSSILAEAGVPYQGAVLATIFISAFGCLIMGFWANAPLILMPGMGINALFAYTLVQGMGLSWQVALAAVTMSGLLFMILAFTPLAGKLNEAIPLILKQAITVGLGLFLIFLGLEKGGIVTRGKHAIIAVGDLGDPFVLATLVTLLLTMILVIRKIPGAFLWSLIIGTIVGVMFGVAGKAGGASISVAPWSDVLFKADFSGIASVGFWSAVFTMTMVIVFETVGLTNGQVRQLKQTEKLPRILKASSLTAFLSGLFGTSPTISALESSSMFASGAKTGLATITTGLFFIASLFLMPVLSFIPNSAIAPILIIIGMSMLQEFKEMDLSNAAETFSALLIIVLIPLTYSIADGIAAGFIAYPILRAFTKNEERTSPVMYVIAALFLLQFIIQ